MKSPICEQLGIEFPLVAFTHCRDVVVAVSKAGGMGVLGAAGYSAEQLEIELAWIDAHIEGKPYGVDLIVPTTMTNKDERLSPSEVQELVPDTHKSFAAGILAQHKIDTTDLYAQAPASGGGFLGEGRAANILDVAFAPVARLRTIFAPKLRRISRTMGPGTLWPVTRSDKLCFKEWNAGNHGYRHFCV